MLNLTTYVDDMSDEGDSQIPPTIVTDATVDFDNTLSMG
jgi:hypothetical protein